MYLTGGTTTVNGPVTNNTTLDLNYQPATFTGAVANYGTIKTTGMTATFASTLTNETGSHYTSDPSTNVFQANVTTNSGSQMSGGTGDQYYLSGGTLNNQGNFNNAGLLQSSDPITNSGTFSQTGTLIQSANFTNSGTTTIGGSQTWVAGTTFTNTGGTATFQSDAGPATATLAINATGGAVNFGSTQHLATLTVGSGATATAAVEANQYVVSTSALNISGTGQLNLNANTLDINFPAAADPATTIRGYIASGYNNDTWTGAGIVSSNAAASPGLYAVGYADGNRDAGTPAGPNQIIVENTLAGDANLDGTVNFADLLVVAQNFNHTLDTHGNPIDWADGDFNYDGVVNFADLLLVAQNFNRSLSASQMEQLPGSFSAAWNLALADVQPSESNNVPEPATAGLLTLVAGGLLARRRRNTRIR
ncbi:MAG: dockerin type I domain-containing protein [Tepidisphaeraceae bacterium]